MNTFRDKKTDTIRLHAGTFRDSMQRTLDKKIMHGKEGIDRQKAYDKPKAPDIVYRNHNMSDQVFELGCAIHDAGHELDYHVWVNWMTDAAVVERNGEVTVYHRNAFYCEYASKFLVNILKNYYNLPKTPKDQRETLFFVPDKNIDAMVCVAA